MVGIGALALMGGNGGVDESTKTILIMLYFMFVTVAVTWSRCCQLLSHAYDNAELPVTMDFNHNCVICVDGNGAGLAIT